MRSSKEIREQISALESELRVAVARETDEARSQILALMEAKGLTFAQLFPEAKGGASPAKNVRKIAYEIRYRDNNGNEWSGRGRMPGWLKAQAEPEQFRVVK